MIKAVIFDIDGVLIDSFEANFKFYQDLMILAGHRPPTPKEFQPLFHLSMIDVIKTFTKLTSDREIKRIWEMGQGKSVNHHFELLTMPKDVNEIINTLSQNYSLGIVTSRIRAYEFSGMARLQKYFKITVSFLDTANHKPHPEPLLLAAKKLGIKPGNCVYIGDVENDAKAGKAAGMKTIIYPKNKINNADACTTSFNKLPELIKSL